MNNLWLTLIKLCLEQGHETADTFELIGLSASLSDIEQNRLTGEYLTNRGLDYRFCESFAQALINGETDLGKIEHLPERARQFINPVLPADLPSNFSIAYGARIKAQESAMLAQLTEGNRRAIMHIWCPDDYKLLEHSEFIGEFACTSSVQLFVRNNLLHCHVHMRSSNVWGILPIDVYNFTELQKHYARQVGLGFGKLTISFGSLHLYKRDLQKAAELLAHNAYEIMNQSFGCTAQFAQTILTNCYKKAIIPRGELGQASKISEEYAEAQGSPNERSYQKAFKTGARTNVSPTSEYTIEQN